MDYGFYGPITLHRAQSERYVHTYSISIKLFSTSFFYMQPWNHDGGMLHLEIDFCVRYAISVETASTTPTKTSPVHVRTFTRFCGHVTLLFCLPSLTTSRHSLRRRMHVQLIIQKLWLTTSARTSAEFPALRLLITSAAASRTFAAIGSHLLTALSTIMVTWSRVSKLPVQTVYGALWNHVDVQGAVKISLLQSGSEESVRVHCCFVVSLAIAIFYCSFVLPVENC